ncbi:MAG: oxidoreductase [Planctomycetota bacterium]|jgi:2,4-dienoyl-CoA reductase-like NADH-dependent reductase (Old Yellow Enzyme family)
MRYQPPGHFKSAAAFAEHLRSLAPDMRCDRELRGAAGPLGQPIEVHGRRIGNRFAVQPMEGWDGTPDGLPGPRTMRRWRRFGESGAKLIWGGEAVAVQRDGRANPNQLFVNPDADSEGGLRTLRETLRAAHASVAPSTDDLLVGLQLTHSGRFARPEKDAGLQPKIAHHHPLLARRFDLRPDQPLLSDAELEEIGERFVQAAEVARRAGFDFVDVKCCHGYLLHELLAAHTRPGPYGGAFENRTRLLRRIIEGIRSACPDLPVGVRISISDTVPFERDALSGVGVPQMPSSGTYRFGFGVDASDPIHPELSEPHRLLRLLSELGVRLVNVTIGSPYYCPHLQRPAAYPPSDGYQPPEDPLLSVAHHLRLVRRCKEACPELTLVGSGYTYLQEYLPHVAQAEVGAGHVDLVGLGRMILAYPELPADVLAGRPLRHKQLCRTFSDCTTAPRNGLPSGCYPLDPEYRSGPEAAELRVIKKTIRSAAKSSS